MNKKAVILISMLVFVSIFIAFFFYKPQKKDELKGLWNIDDNTKYEFSGEGDGKLIVSSDEFKFTYKIRDNILSIDFEDEESIDTEYIFVINNDELELKNLDESHLIFNLKKIN